MDVIQTGAGEVPVLALHGIQGTRAAWLPGARELHDDARFVLPNLRGRGAAWRGACADDYTLARYADDVAETVARHIGDGPYVLAGWSLGVSVALDYVTHRVGRLPRALVLVSGSPALCMTQWFSARDERALHDEIAAREVRLKLSEAADRQAVAWTWQSIRTADHRPLLETIDLPTLIVHGSDDDDCPFQHARWLADGLPRARLVEIAGGGHTILTAHTAALAEAMRTFLVEQAPILETP
ncbi:Pimeloyl-ACP methyl ester carboxylesterase [Paraburkholderia caballeronis]|uniref:Pimeloyl-ACP methyl ester carboxylesterase n=2 Tax=Paraburkholderia caballeronis TaxID=416943 RepID=A0A1H7LWQ3_9BURK|nr:pimeloyl-ACP methyl ester carboxylesterase [Paraburkholderia caballeronis]PXX03998.1 pimeloyl-ACP methyl ester carboxylesterase [Paraburkholderia caballeronis]RAK04742.1 pimeloyl-ACP methyl ester carboxylesterase [Paraburkholderia caballeronis]SED67214.1 Pimeloyl-ACP methyl ester carboxylesterase [Paraburkholderia caballeronis]SEL03374.1 Pimeloyl-ACP methyl ester carboxylesterase [Paraburkholderia caballeronis]